MRRTFFIFFLLVLSASFCFSQKNEANEVLLKKATEALYDHPEQTLKIAQHLLNNPGTRKEKAQTNLLLAKSHLVTGNYMQALANVLTALEDSKASHNQTLLFDAYLLAAEIYTALDLFEIAATHHTKATQIAKGNVALEREITAYGFLTADSIGDVAALTTFINAETPANSVKNALILHGSTLQLAGRALQKINRPDSAAVYFEKSLTAIGQNQHSAYWKMLALIDYSDYFLAKKDYMQTVSLLEQALEIQKEIANPYFSMVVNKKLADVSITLGNTLKFQEYRKKAAAAENEYDTRITLATNFAFADLQQENAVNIKQEKNLQENTNVFFGVALVLILLVWLAFRWYFTTKKKHISDLINYLKLIRQTKEHQSDPVKSQPKSLSIPKETETVLLSRLEKFETGKKYLSKEISLAQLAAMFDTNTKYLSEVINKYKGKNFNAYINGLRIQYMVDKLRNDPKYLNYKVSYLAEECGFSSHSMFSAAFKNVSGITPNVFIQFLTEDAQQSKPIAQL